MVSLAGFHIPYINSCIHMSIYIHGSRAILQCRVSYKTYLLAIAWEYIYIYIFIYLFIYVLLTSKQAFPFSLAVLLKPRRDKKRIIVKTLTSRFTWATLTRWLWQGRVSSLWYHLKLSCCAQFPHFDKTIISRAI